MTGKSSTSRILPFLMTFETFTNQVHNFLMDFGASLNVMPYFICKKLNVEPVGIVAKYQLLLMAITWRWWTCSSYKNNEDCIIMYHNEDCIIMFTETEHMVSAWDTVKWSSIWIINEVPVWRRNNTYTEVEYKHMWPDRICIETWWNIKLKAK